MDKSSKKKKLFRSNSKYFTISVYAIITFAICLLIFRFTNNWKSTKEQIGEIFYIEDGDNYILDGKLNTGLFDTENELFI